MHRSIESLLAEARESGRSLPETVLALEVSESGRSAEEIRGRIRRTLGVMREAIREGLEGEVRSPSGLTGGRARRLMENGPRLLGARVTQTLARAISTLEVNAAMGLIVAAPTAGAAGVLPAILISAGEFMECDEELLIDAMLVAGGVGGVIAHRASLAGAEGGCQAETGLAAAMGAAAVSLARAAGRRAGRDRGRPVAAGDAGPDLRPDRRAGRDPVHLPQRLGGDAGDRGGRDGAGRLTSRPCGRGHRRHGRGRAEDARRVP